MSKSLTVIEYLRQRVTEKIIDSRVGEFSGLTEQQMRKAEWCEKFEQYMRNRLLVGCFRHGKMARTTDTDYDRIGSVRERLDLHDNDGNMEHLVDVAALCMMEFVHGTHPNRHWNPLDEGGVHTQKITD
jgi:hypothetical protein